MDNTKERILKATRDLFFEMGAKKVTMRDIATRCAISPGNLTYYFRRKEDLFAAVFEDLLLQEYGNFPQSYKNRENPWITFIAVNYVHLKAVVQTASTLASFIYASNFPSSREAYIQVSSDLLFKSLQNTPYARDSRSVWLASMVGCGGEFEAIHAYNKEQNKLTLDELIMPTFSVRMFLLDLQPEAIDAFVKEGMEVGKSIHPKFYSAYRGT